MGKFQTADFADLRGFLWLETAVITANDAENAENAEAAMEQAFIRSLWRRKFEAREPQPLFLRVFRVLRVLRGILHRGFSESENPR